MLRRRVLTTLPALLLAVSVALALLVVSPTAALAASSVEQDFLNRVNAERAAQGLPKLALNTDLADVARGWSATMASRNKLEHRPGLGTEVSNSVTDAWTRVGENVGYTTNASRESQGALVARLHEAFMNSPGHRANVLGKYNQAGVGVVVAGNGTMWVTVNFMQAPLTAASQTPQQRDSANPEFAGWTQLAASGPVSAPAAVSWGKGRSDLFVVDSAGRLLHRWFVNGQGGPGNSWRALGRPSGVKLVGQPAAVSQTSGSLDIFARGSDNQLWHRAYRPGSGWSGWFARGGTITSAPSAVSWRNGHIAIFATTPSGTVWERSWANRWYPWRSVGSGAMTSAPAVTSWESGRMDVFARGSDGALKHKYYLTGSGWSGWIDRGGLLQGAGRPDAVSWGKGRLDVFVVGGSGAGKLYRIGYQTGRGWVPGAKTFDGLSNPGGRALDSGTASLSWGAGHLQVFAVAGNGQIWHRTTE